MCVIEEEDTCVCVCVTHADNVCVCVCVRMCALNPKHTCRGSVSLSLSTSLSPSLSPSLPPLLPPLSFGFAFERLTRVIEVQKHPNGSAATLAPPNIYKNIIIVL